MFRKLSQSCSKDVEQERNGHESNRQEAEKGTGPVNAQVVEHLRGEKG